MLLDDHTLEFLLQEFLHDLFVTLRDLHEIREQPQGPELMPVRRDFTGKQAPHTLRAVSVARQGFLQGLLARPAPGVFAPQGFDFCAQGSFRAPRLIERLGGLRNGLRKCGKRSRITLMVGDVGLELRGKPAMLGLDAGLVRLGASCLTLDRQSRLFRLHELIAQLRRLADGSEQGLAAGIDILLGDAELEVQILLAHQNLCQGVFRCRPLLLQLFCQPGAFGGLLRERLDLGLEFRTLDGRFLPARLQGRSLLFYLLQAREPPFVLQVTLRQPLPAMGELVLQFLMPLGGGFLLVFQRLQFLSRSQAGFLHLGMFRAQPLDFSLERFQAGSQDSLQPAAQFLVQFPVTARLRSLALQ